MVRHKNITGYLFFFVFITLLTIFSGCDGGSDTKTVTEQKQGENTLVNISTNYGDIEVQLFDNEAPVTVENFLSYVKEDFYSGTVFHRVISGFMIQGGGFTTEMNQKETKEPIKNEAGNGLKNERGTLAMARTSDVNSATSQFFINLTDNEFLDHGVRDYGYAVFGKVTGGMDVVDKIASVETRTSGYMQNIPAEPVIINSISVIEK